MENNIQAGLVKQSPIQTINYKKQEDEEKTPAKKINTLAILDKITINSSTEKNALLNINNTNGFLEISKARIKSIDDGISKLHELNEAFSSLETGHNERINILNRVDEIVKDVQSTTKNTNFHNQSIASFSNNNIDSKQINLSEHEEEEDSRIVDIEKIDQAIKLLTKNKENLQEQIHNLSDYIEKEEIFGSSKDDIEMTQQELDVIKENLRDKSDLLSVTHKVANGKIASLFF